MHSYTRTFISLILVTIICSCARMNTPEITTDGSDVLARVGEEIITAREFQLDYEFGHANLKQAADSKQKYLSLIINEKLLAQEAIALKLDTAVHIQQAVQTISEERLIEEVFNQKVLNNIEITEEEIKEEINKGAVSFQLQYLASPSRQSAIELRQRIQRVGLDSVLQTLNTEMQQNPLTAEDITSPYMSYAEVDPQLLDIVKELELRQPSEPVFYQNQWYVFMVANIKRARLAPEDYAAKSTSARKILYNRKAMEGATKYISGLMEPLEISTKRAVFEQLNDAMYAWYQQEPPTGDVWIQVQNKNQEEFHYSLTINSIKDEILVEFSDDQYSVEQFLRRFNSSRYQFRADGYRSFTSRFADIIALVVRDSRLFDIAKKEQMGKNPEVTRDIRQWKQKWVFQEMREQVFDTLAFSDDKVRDYFEANRNEFEYIADYVQWTDLGASVRDQIRKKYLSDTLAQKAAGLKDKYQVTINNAVLDTINVNRSDDHPFMQVQLFKQNSNRLAFPTVDPNWVP